MSYQQFDRFAIKMEPLSSRPNKKFIEQDHIAPTAEPSPLTAFRQEMIHELAERIQSARKNDRPVMITFGAHAIKNGLGPVLLGLIENNWVTHLATNGAGIIHDWEFAFQGKSCEDVCQMVEEGRFGNWEETGFNINLALNIGAYEGRGYGESVGALIDNEAFTIPDPRGTLPHHSRTHRRPGRSSCGGRRPASCHSPISTPCRPKGGPTPLEAIQHPSGRFPAGRSTNRSPDDWARHYLQPSDEPLR